MKQSKQTTSAARLSSARSRLDSMRRASSTAIAIATVSSNYSPRAYQRDGEGELVTNPPPAALAQHEFRASADGELEHYIDGRLRATVPPEGLAGYAHFWPDCAPLAQTLQRADR